jgi:hypothetical protein
VDSRDLAVSRLWKASALLPQSVRLLGTRYRSLFLAHAQECTPQGGDASVADALAFVEFMLVQERVGLLDSERAALQSDARRLRRRFKLLRDGAAVTAVEKWRVRQWIGI